MHVHRTIGIDGCGGDFSKRGNIKKAGEYNYKKTVYCVCNEWNS